MDIVDTLKSTKSKSFDGGGKDKVEMQHNLNKLTARERIGFLFDEGSFIEIGGLIKGNGAGVITGYGTINGKLVYAYSQDYTVDGGAVNKVNSQKICDIMDTAVKMGCPLVQVFDSVGGNLDEGLGILPAYGEIIKRNTQLSGVIPQISVIAGPCTGIAALSATLSDFTIMVEETSQLYINSPVELTEKEETYVYTNMYAEGNNCSENGSAQFIAKNDNEALGLVRKLIDYIPSNNLETVAVEGDQILASSDEKLNEFAKNAEYDIYEVINRIADANSFLETNVNWEKGLVTGLIKLNGLTVGVIANNKKENDAKLNIKTSEKISRLAKLCSCFNIPIISLVDTKGFVVSIEEEKQGLALYASKMVYTLAEADVPKVALILGEAAGAAYLCLASKEAAFDVTYAWPSAKISITQPEKLIKSLYRKEIVEAEDPKAKEKEIIEKYMDEITNPYKAAEEGYVDDMIIPSETKMRLFAVVDMLQSKRELSYPKKHGSTLI